MKELRARIRKRILEKGIIMDEETIKRLVDIEVREHIKNSWIKQIRDQFNKRFKRSG